MKLRTHAVAAMLIAGLLPASALAQSHPAWWTYASPEATALVGIRWNNLRGTPFAGAVSGELRPGGSLRLPNVPILSSADQILISSPELLAIEYGIFPADQLARQANGARMRSSTYRGVDLWLSTDPEELSIARLDDHLLLLGYPETLEDAIERGQYRAATREAEPGTEIEEGETPTSAQRPYTPLLAIAAKYSQEDLWAVSSQFPDPLASLFVPLSVQADAFEGSVSLWQGMHLVAGITADTVAHAVDIMDYLRQAVSGMGPMSRELDVKVDEEGGKMVLVRMDLTERELAAALNPGGSPGGNPQGNRGGATRQQTAPTATRPTQPPASTVRSQPQNARTSTAPAAREAEPAKPKPRVVRIIGLDSQPKEIELPESEHQQ